MPEISQEQLDALNAKAKEAEEAKTEKDKLAKELEETRMEVLSPDYTAFLESQEKSKEKEKEKEKPKEDLSKLSPDQLLEKATEKALAEFRKEQKARDDDAAKAAEDRNKREIDSFKKGHEDFETYRPVMYGLSKDPKNADLTLPQLYEAAKKHVATIAGTTEAQKEKSRRSTHEKPGGTTESLEKIRKTSTYDLNREALEEVKSQLGPIPAA